MNYTKDFEISCLLNSEYRAVIFATGVINPLSVLSDIEKELSNTCGPCNIIFDLLLSNGETSNRYISAFYDGKRFCPGTFKITRSLPKDFKRIASEFYDRQKYR